MLEKEILEKVIYRDALMLVLNKPAGIPVHKGKGGGENLEQYFEHLRYGLPRIPALAHRLDRDTSGCLILGRHRKALAKLGLLFKQNKIKKTYWAMVVGAPPAAEGIIDAPLGKKNNDKSNWHMMVRDDGQPAITEYKILGQAAGKTFLELKPQTGRTHQLRVHCAHIGCPILGDKIYGKIYHNPLPGEGVAGGDLMLHAYSVEIPIYKNREAVKVIAPTPEWLTNLFPLA